MATPAGRLIQDQNLNIHSTGALLGGKVDASRPTKNGALGGRKALNDISNSGKPAALLPSTKKSINVVPTGKDLGGASKAHSCKNQEKGKASGRKPLSDLTNTVKPSLQHLSMKSQDKKLSIPSAVQEEAFLHNHEECLKAQRETVSFDYFQEIVGMAKGSSLVLRESLKPESPVKHLEMEEMPMMPNEDDFDKSWQAEFPGVSSPMSVVESAYDNWKDDFLDLKLVESPKSQKY